MHDRIREVDMSNVPKLLTIMTAAEATGIARWRLYELIARGEGPPHMRIGKTIRISTTALAKWIEEQHQQVEEDGR
jgi:excisionase family DNA binding protein